MSKITKIIFNLDEVLSIINQSLDNRSAFTNTIEYICRQNGWSYGEAWTPESKTSQLKLYTHWSLNDEKYSTYLKFSQLCKFAKGIGLPGATWQKNKILWFSQLTSGSIFLRADLAKDAGFNASVSFPMYYSAELIAIFSFFFENKKYSDEKFIKALYQNIHILAKELRNKY